MRTASIPAMRFCFSLMTVPSIRPPLGLSRTSKGADTSPKMHWRIQRVRLIEANILDVVIGRQLCHSHAILSLRHPGQNESAIRAHPSEFSVRRRRVRYDAAVDGRFQLDAHLSDAGNRREWLA